MALDAGYLFMNVRNPIQNLPKESPETTAVLIEALVYCVPQSTLLTVLHLKGLKKKYVFVCNCKSSI